MDEPESPNTSVRCDHDQDDHFVFKYQSAASTETPSTKPSRKKAGNMVDDLINILKAKIARDAGRDSENDDDKLFLLSMCPKCIKCQLIRNGR